jgi:hypothetical protein
LGGRYCRSYREEPLLRANLYAPLGRVAGLAIIEFQDVKTTSRSDECVECTASVMLNNNTQHHIRYSFFVRNKQVFVEANILDL